MEIFKLFESAMANIQPGHMNIKDLRRDQLLDHYDDATKALQTLIRAKESEIAFRKDLIGMLDQSKVAFDNKLTQAKQNYQSAKKQAPESLDLRGPPKNSDNNVSDSATTRSTTPPLPPPTSTQISVPPPIVANTNNSSTTGHHHLVVPNASSQQQQIQQQSPMKNSSDLDIPLPTDNHENRTSLDRRLSEFLKTFPNLTQAGLAPPVSNNDIAKPLPGYYTQQSPQPNAPSLMAMMRFPPPNMLPIQQQQQQNKLHQPIMSNQENHGTADMELSDNEESAINSTGTSSNVPVIPMIANALQRGAGGKQNVAETTPTYVSVPQFNNAPIQYAPRLNALPFDPSIMDPSIRDGSSSSSRDRHSPGGHRHGNSSRGSGSDSKHSSSKNRYSSSSSTSSHSSSRSKRR